jgi:hypothetical protein
MRAKSGKNTMRKRLAALAAMTTALSALGLVTAAHAGVTFIPYGNPPPGAHLVTDFATLTGDDSGTASLFTGSDSDAAAPALSSTTRDTAQYLVVEGGESERLVLPAAWHVDIYVGSLDPYNTISFGGPGAVSYTGVDLAKAGAIDNGDQQSGLSNGLFEFSFAAPVTSVTFSSSENSLEVASVSSAVPEPSTWAMMLIGFAGLGYAAYRKTKTERMAFA